MPTRPEIRTLTRPDQLSDWYRAVATGFLRGPEVSPEAVEFRRGGTDLARTQGAYDGERCVGTFRTTPQLLTVPGGAALPSAAVTNVTVSPTHRRRGLLTGMMGNALRAARERGDAFASLISAEYPIYGRYGFGPAAWMTEWEVAVSRARLDPRYAGPADLGDGGRVDIVDSAEFRQVAPAVHERFRAQPERQGAIDRDARWWSLFTGELRMPDEPFRAPFHAVYRDADGVPQGAATYDTDDTWTAKMPEQTLTVRDLFATTPVGEAALWRFLLSMEWVQRVRTGVRAPDDVLPLLLPDPRSARTVAHADFLWLRPLDVPRMLATRTYAVPGTLVLELRDKEGWAGGRFRLETGTEGAGDATGAGSAGDATGAGSVGDATGAGSAGGAACVVTHDDPDLSMDVGELGTLYLGDESVTRLAALGRVTEHRAGAVRTADALFRTGRRAWCPDTF